MTVGIASFAKMNATVSDASRERTSLSWAKSILEPELVHCKTHEILTPVVVDSPISSMPKAYWDVNVAALQAE